PMARKPRPEARSAPPRPKGRSAPVDGTFTVVTAATPLVVVATGVAVGTGVGVAVGTGVGVAVGSGVAVGAAWATVTSSQALWPSEEVAVVLVSPAVSGLTSPTFLVSTMTSDSDQPSATMVTLGVLLMLKGPSSAPALALRVPTDSRAMPAMVAAAPAARSPTAPRCADLMGWMLLTVRFITCWSR